MNALCVDFLNYIRSERRLSKNTHVSYKSDLNVFISYFSDIEITAIDNKLFKSFIEKLQESRSQSSVQRMYITLKMFFKFLRKERIVFFEPMVHLKKPFVKKQSILTVSEVFKLLDLASKIFPEKYVMVMELMYGSGLRVSEALFLKLSDVREHMLLIRGKGGKERLVPTTPYFLQYIKKLNIHNKDYIFSTKKGRPIDRFTIYNVIKRLQVLSGIDKKISPHTFRRSFASHLFENGAELDIIQDLLGHANIETTNKYVAQSQEALNRNFERFHPRYNIKLYACKFFYLIVNYSFF